MSISYKLSGKYGKGKSVLVSEKDYLRFKGKKLCVLKSGYVMIWDNKTVQYLHRWIFSLQAGNRNEDHVDHKNGDKLDCRRENLRIGTRSDNMCNVKKMEGCSSKYKGVCRLKNGQFISNIKKNGVAYSLGKFKSEVKAALAYNEKAKTLHKNYAVLNIIPEELIRIDEIEDMKRMSPEFSNQFDEMILGIRNYLKIKR